MNLNHLNIISRKTVVDRFVSKTKFGQELKSSTDVHRVGPEGPRELVGPVLQPEPSRSEGCTSRNVVQV